MLIISDILAIRTPAQFEDRAVELFRFQAEHCPPYTEYLSLIGVDVRRVSTVADIPFLPIELFKERRVYCGAGDPEVAFTSSNTGGTQPATHYMESVEAYRQTFMRAFELVYGDIKDYSVYGLLPNYLARRGSSLVYMVDQMIDAGRGGGFYLDNYPQLLADMEQDGGKKILLGVSYALLDLTERYSPQLTNTIVMETGGMKGQREELTKSDLHSVLCHSFGVAKIHSEYGMAELTSQAYSLGDGVFTPPPWMRILVRDVNDPFDVSASGRGGVNIIDLANLSSCAFIQTQDLGVVDSSGRFSILGRIDHSEIRGCNLLVALS